MKIFGFYHIFAVNNYEYIITDQINNLKSSGLFDKTDTLTISIIGNESSVSFAKLTIEKQLNKTDLNKVNIITLQNNVYESAILNEILRLSTIDDFYCYYFHTKGVSITNQNVSFYHGLDYKTVSSSCEAWRKAMEFFVFENYEVCINELNNGVDAVGMNLRTAPKLHFSGNFWWSKSDHIKKLQPIKNSKDRYSCEFWLSSCDRGVFKSLSENKSGYSVIDSEYKKIFKNEYEK